MKLLIFLESKLKSAYRPFSRFKSKENFRFDAQRSRVAGQVAVIFEELKFGGYKIELVVKKCNASYHLFKL